uniref:Uncharacterized protein n=1 Tax=Chromera velia CCMP2878 TaxID=1169474 RepID=A0A0G4F3S0_9ALVE|eukprot:Cvel_14922.t1-p1 / transcript=Cvel_14922.t1 / gene=Cvel_14922 / organism=Chromera_velia_CCMP2878 / gene_product=hypothetical protein / transcript_product=hypothetical protein / location=Cvel_scaffold1081:21764-22081(+) / protein_length=106 / sequence_SO=supercontig / SO=protein_coding / is_pseudo=false
MTSHYISVHTYIPLLMKGSFGRHFNNQVMEASFGDIRRVMRGGQGGVGANWGTSGGFQRNPFFDVISRAQKCTWLGADPENEGFFAGGGRKDKRRTLGRAEGEEGP